MPGRSVSKLLFTLAILLSLNATKTALAGNDDGLPIGSQAAQTAGAVTATVAGGAAAFYNPAGLAMVDAPSIDASMNAYGMRLYKVRRLIEGPMDRHQGAQVLDIVFVPTMLAHVIKLTPRVAVSGGLYVPKAQDYALSARFVSAEKSVWSVTQSEDEQEQQAAIGVAFAVSEALRLGMSFFAISERDELLQLIYGTRDGESGPALSLQSMISHSQYGGSLRAGVQWNILPQLAFGATVVAPALIVMRKFDDRTIVFLPDETGEGTDSVVLESRRSRYTSDFSGTPSIRVGVAWRHERMSLALDGTVNLPLDGQGNDQDRDLSFNVRAGGQYDVDDRLKLGAGLFTDRNPLRARALDFYGLTLGGQLRKSYELRDGRTIAFLNGVNVRYAVGYGSATALRVPSLAPGADATAFENFNSRTIVHELSLNVGSGLSF